MLVTIVSDYAALIEQLAPAAFSDARRPHSQHRSEIVRRHGGLVNQAVEDEIVSLFGVPASHEDDDLRAVRAAMELHAQPSRDPGGPVGGALALRSGVHAGPLVAQRLNDGQRRYGVSGAPAQVAARLAAIAPRDAMLVSPECQRIVAPFVHTQPASDGGAAGRDGSGDALSASSANRDCRRDWKRRRARASRPMRAVTPSSRRWKRNSSRRARAAGRSTLVIGEAGVGKSRLLHELRGRVDASDMRVLQGRCRSYGGLASYSPFVETLREVLRCRLRKRAALASKTSWRASRAIAPALEPFVPLYLHLLSHDERVSSTAAAPARRASAVGDGRSAHRAARRRWRTSRRRCCCWKTGIGATRGRAKRCASSSRSPSAHALLDRRHQPARSCRDRRDPGMPRAFSSRRSIFEGSVEIMRGVLHVPRVSEELARHVHERTGGNPFFLEEICQTLVEQGLVTVRDGEGVAAGGVAALRLPDTVQAVIRARLDGLDRESLEVLRIASVIGREFAQRPAGRFHAGGRRADRRAGAPEDGGADPADQPGAGSRLSLQTRADAGGDLRQPARAPAALAARHAWAGPSSADMRSSSTNMRTCSRITSGSPKSGASAVDHGRRAADRAIALSQFADALATLDRVREWLARLPDDAQSAELLADVLLQQERLCETLGQRGRQQEIIGELVALLAPRGASERLAQAYLRQGDLLTLLKRYNEADRALSTSLRLSRERHDAALERHVLRSIGLLRWHEGRYAEALAITDSALEIDRQREDELAVAGDLANRGFILKSMGEYELARASLEEAIAIPAQAAEPATLVYTLQGLANIYRALGDLERAMELLQRTEEISRRHRRPLLRSFHLMAIAHVHLQRGEIEQSLRTYEESVETSRRARHADGLVQSLRAHGEVLLGLGRYAEALPRLQEAARLFAQLGDRQGEVEMLACVAVLHERSDGARSRPRQTWDEVRACVCARRCARRAGSARRASCACSDAVARRAMR